MKRMGYGVLALVLAACESSTAPVEPGGADDAAIVEIAAAAGVVDRTTDGGRGGALFDRLAGAIPGFAGFYFAGCDLVVVLTDRGAAEKATDLLAPLLRRYHASVRRRCPDGGGIRVQHGDYTWQQLSRYLEALRPITRTRGVGRIAIAIPDNRIVVQVASRDVARRVAAFAESVGVPPAALSFIGVR